LLPVDVSQVPGEAARDNLAWSWLTRPPVTAGSRSAFPLQSESRCVSGGLVSGSTIARGLGAVNGS
jgi:hypothetical protein